MSNPIHLRRSGPGAAALAVAGRSCRTTGRRAGRAGEPRPRSGPSSCSAARPSPTPARRCSTAISASPPAPRSWASAFPPSSTAPLTANDAVAANAKDDLTTAYNVAAGQPVSRANNLTGTNLGNRTLTAGAYRYSSSAQLTGAAHPRRPGRSQRAVRLRDRLDADHRRGQLGGSRERSLTLQRVLAGRQLGHARHHHGLPGQPDGAHEHLAEQRGHGGRAGCSPATARISLINNVLSTARNCAASTTPRRYRRHGWHRRDRQWRRRWWHRQQRRHPERRPALTRAQRRARNGTATMRRVAASRLHGRIPRNGPRSPDPAGGLPAGRKAHRQPRQFPLPGARARRSRPCTGSGRTSRSGTPPAPRTLRSATAPVRPRSSSPARARRGSPVDSDPPRVPRPPGVRRGVSLLVVALLTAFGCGGHSRARRRAAGARQPAARGADARSTSPEPTRMLTHAGSSRCAARRPLTGVRTVLPVLGPTGPVPGCTSACPGGPTGTPAGSAPARPSETSTPWRIAGGRLRAPGHGLSPRPRQAPVLGGGGQALDADPTRPLLHRGGAGAVRRGPRRPVRAGHQRAIERSSGIRGRPGPDRAARDNGLSGALGTAASHGCVRLSTDAITWLARRIGSGVPLTIRN